MTTAYRLDRRLKLRQDLEHLADEEEATLEQLAQDLELVSESQDAEVRIRTKGVNLIEREDVDEVKRYVDDLLKKAEKAAQEKKERRKQRIKFAAKIIGVTAAVLSLGYEVSRIPLQREAQIQDLEERLTYHLRDAADIDCDRRVKIKEFYPFYRKATGKDFFHQSLDSEMYVNLSIDDTKSIAVRPSPYHSSGVYQITLSPQIAEQLLQTKGNRSCSITLE